MTGKWEEDKDAAKILAEDGKAAGPLRVVTAGWGDAGLWQLQAVSCCLLSSLC